MRSKFPQVSQVQNWKNLQCHTSTSAIHTFPAWRTPSGKPSSAATSGPDVGMGPKCDFNFTVFERYPTCTLTKPLSILNPALPQVSLWPRWKISTPDCSTTSSRLDLQNLIISRLRTCWAAELRSVCGKYESMVSPPDWIQSSAPFCETNLFLHSQNKNLAALSEATELFHAEWLIDTSISSGPANQLNHTDHTKHKPDGGCREHNRERSFFRCTWTFSFGTTWFQSEFTSEFN